MAQPQQFADRAYRRRRYRLLLALPLMLAVGGAWRAAAGAFDDPSAAGPAQSAATEPTSPSMDRLDDYIAALGADGFTAREAATRSIIALGPQAVDLLRSRLPEEHDPEVVYRIRFILENITPPDRAVLILRAPPETTLAAGEVITHANGQRVRQLGDIPPTTDRRLAVYRVTGLTGPRDVGPLRLSADDVRLVNYRAPRGETLARVVQLYAAGFVEQAYDLLKSVGEIPDDEFDRLLFAMIAHTAGDGAQAESLLSDTGGDALGEPWSKPSSMDQRGPCKAPFHLEWVDLSRTERRQTANDPDLRVQRVLAVANRFADALVADAGYWWNDFRLSIKGRVTTAGNMLAVVAWMFHEMGLESECTRLIGPRSMFLAGDRWLRVQTDAWLPLLAGRPAAAVETIFTDAQSVLQHETDPNRPYRNPRVAAMAALFLYLQPNDARVSQMFDTVLKSDSPAVADYVRWMLYSVNHVNDDTVRGDLVKFIASTRLESRCDIQLSAAVLEYVQEKPSEEIFELTRRRCEKTGVAGARTAAIIACLSALSQDKLDDAAAALAGAADVCGAGVLADTIDFRRSHASTGGEDARRALLATRVAETEWLVVTPERKLVRFEEPSGRVTPQSAPLSSTTGWFPGPANWPWIGRNEKSHRVWIYDRRRVLEIGRENGLRLNIDDQDVRDFDELLSPLFDDVAGAVAAHAALSPPRNPAAEEGEFLRAEIQAYPELVADPDLPEISEFRELAEDPRIVHVALRGGPQFLIRRDAGAGRKIWSSLWVRDQLKLANPPRFFPQAVRVGPARESSTPPASPALAPTASTIFLMSSDGLFRLDTAADVISRIKIPGDFPYPELIPESTPYERRDPRFVYCARLPRDTGRVIRVTVADNSAVELEMVNEALPPNYYRLMPRSAVRNLLNNRFAFERLPDIETFITDAAAVARASKDRSD